MEKCQDKLLSSSPPRRAADEQHIGARPGDLVIFRKLRTVSAPAWGAAGYAAVCSVIETGMLRGLSAFAAIRTCLACGSSARCV